MRGRSRAVRAAGCPPSRDSRREAYSACGACGRTLGLFAADDNGEHKGSAGLDAAGRGTATSRRWVLADTAPDRPRELTIAQVGVRSF